MSTSSLPPTELWARAIARARTEKLQAHRLDDRTYWVKSRFLEAGKPAHEQQRHVLAVGVDDQAQRHVQECRLGTELCPSWEHRRVCVHAAAVELRLLREGARKAAQARRAQAPRREPPARWRDTIANIW